MTRTFRHLSLLALVSILVGCGGAGSDGGSTSRNPEAEQFAVKACEAKPEKAGSPAESRRRNRAAVDAARQAAALDPAWSAFYQDWAAREPKIDQLNATQPKSASGTALQRELGGILERIADTCEDLLS